MICSRFRGSLAAFAATPTPATTTGAAGRELLPRFLQHRFRIGSRPHDPQHQIVGCGRGFEQQGRTQAHPAVHQFLGVIHGNRYHLGLLTSGALVGAAFLTRGEETLLG